MYNYKAKLLKVVDGDTVDLFIDLGFETWIRRRIRLMGVNTPERGHPGFAEATEFVASWFRGNDNKCTLRSFAPTTEKNDKYGRYLGGIFSDDETAIALNEALINQGWGQEY
jgi:micrococcal nuclease